MQSGIQPEVRNEATNEIRHQYLDSTKAKTQLGWTPAFTFDESLKATVDWYRRYFAEHDTAAEAAGG
jgi:CDP-glucose 4,6-dehydratase